jgi:hypothetical protein
VPGRLLFHISSMPHARFVRKGNDLHYRATISLLEALTGTTLKIRHLDGRAVSVPRVGVTKPGACSRRRSPPADGAQGLWRRWRARACLCTDAEAAARCLSSSACGFQTPCPPSRRTVRHVVGCPRWWLTWCGAQRSESCWRHDGAKAQAIDKTQILNKGYFSVCRIRCQRCITSDGIRAEASEHAFIDFVCCRAKYSIWVSPSIIHKLKNSLEVDLF